MGRRKHIQILPYGFPIILLFTILLSAELCPAMKPPIHPMLLWQFNHSLSEATGLGVAMENHGGTYLNKGISGGCIRLTSRAYLTLDKKDIFSSPRGSFSIWVRPLWNDFGEIPSGSHTFVSFAWENADAFGVLSDGWWERSGGQPWTYLIFNNQLKAKTQDRVAYIKNKWINFVFTWDTNNPSGLKFYVNGLLKPEVSIPILPGQQLKQKLVIGSDHGATSSQNRYADCDVDEISVYDRVLSCDEVLKKYLDQAPKPPPFPINQVRAIFDEGRGWMTPEGATETISRIHRAGFNTYIPCVWHGMGSRYPTTLTPAEIGSTHSTSDSLEQLIKVAHSAGIKVHPWFTVMLRQRKFHKVFFDVSTPDQAFDVHSPIFRRFITDLILDVCLRYDIDGINLDFIRSMGFCSCPRCRDQYHSIYQRDLMTDITEANRDTSSPPPTLIQWNENAVEDIVATVSLKARQIRPDIIISVDGSPASPFSPKNPQGRNELMWSDKGYIDIIFNMDYKSNPDLERLKFINQANTGTALVLPLLGNYEKGTQIFPRDSGRVSDLIELSLMHFPEGVGLYIYSQLSDAQIKTLGQLFKGR